MKESYQEYQRLCEEALSACVFPGAEEENLEAMRYSLLGGGKRLRGVLVLASCVCAGGEAERALPAACAVEMVHAYSLIHDDLPAMDNDVLRRGKPTCHVRFGEAQAILAGDGLLTEAFSVLAESYEAPVGAGLVALLSRAAGPGGMVGGQVLDMSPPREADLAWLRKMVGKKTGCLIEASVEMGLKCAGAGEEWMACGRRYGIHLGRAFQIVDDILDVVGDEKTLGKSIGKDAAEEKRTFVTLLGLEEARRQALEETGHAVSALEPFGERGAFLSRLARDMLDRIY